MKKTKIIVLTIFMMLFTNSIFPFFVGNYSDKGFNSENQKSTLGAFGETSINQYLIVGGSYYLRSYSNFIGFMDKVELSALDGLNYEVSLEIVNASIDNLNNAKMIYSRLTQLADTTPYNQIVVDQLINFDYHTFFLSKNMNPIIFKIVEDFLAKGDIRGIYHKLYADVSNITVQLNRIKAILEKKEFPTITELWNIHQSYTNSIFFGQYVASVFIEIN